jgi:hypothetical protein
MDAHGTQSDSKNRFEHELPIRIAELLAQSRRGCFIRCDGSKGKSERGDPLLGAEGMITDQQRCPLIEAAHSGCDPIK